MCVERVVCVYEHTESITRRTVYAMQSYDRGLPKQLCVLTSQVCLRKGQLKFAQVCVCVWW